MIPAEFDAADDVFPEVILRGGGQCHGAIWIGRCGRIDSVEREEFLLTAIAEIFAPEVEAELFSCLERSVACQGVGFSRHVMDIQVIKCRSESKTTDGRRYRRADVIAGAVFVVIGAVFVFVEAVDNAGFQSGPSQEAYALGRGNKKGSHEGLGRFGFAIFAERARIDSRTFRVGDADGSGK